jgi:acetyl-CoA carboxylase biotin carboxyl carrier protein
MSDHDEELEQIRQAAAELLPQLTERLARHGLGQLEVRQGELRMRVVADASAGVTVSPRDAVEPVAANAPPAVASHHGVTSPAVGFFIFADGLGPGLGVQKGDPLGFVEMLGVRHDVRAPRSGVVRNLVTEAGEPVEYGQLLIELEPGE